MNTNHCGQEADALRAENAELLAQRDSAVNSLRSLEAHYQKTHDAMREAHRQLDLVTGALEGFVRLVDKGDYGPWDFQAAYEQAKEALAALRKPTEQTAAVRDVLAERRRQIEAEGWTPEHDDAHRDGDLEMAAACYAYNVADSDPEGEGRAPFGWPWDKSWWKPSTPRRDLVKASALILAAIERRDRAEAAQTAGAPALYAMHIPGPDDLYAMPSKEVAEICAAKHNAAIGEYLDTLPLKELSPSRESCMANVVEWDGTAEDHAEALTEFDAAEWGIGSPADEGGNHV